MKKISVVAATLALLAACGSDSEPPSDEVETTAPVTTAVATAEAVVSTAPGAMPTVMTEDLIYHPGGERFTAKSGLVDVISPTAGGPWPTVIVFHGDPRFATKGWHRPDAQLVAEQGRVVFLPSWGHTTSSAASEMGLQSVEEMIVQELSCAVLFGAG